MKRLYGLAAAKMPKRTRTGDLFWWVTKNGVRERGDDGRILVQHWKGGLRRKHTYELRTEEKTIHWFKSLAATRDWLNMSELERIVLEITRSPRGRR